MRNYQISNSKLIVITRRDLSPGSQAVQAAHAAIEFQYEFPEVAKEWNTNSKYLVFLSTQDEQSLKSFIERAKQKNIKYSIFVEPDMNDEITAVALEPTQESQKLCSSLPLALKEYNKETVLT